MHNYTYKYHKEAATGDGFNYPVDVYYGTIHLGTLVALPDGFEIRMVPTPIKNQAIKQTPDNKFKSVEIAARAIHKVWKHFRFGGYDNNDTGDTVPV